MRDLEGNIVKWKLANIAITSAQVITSKRGPDKVILKLSLPNPAFPFDKDSLAVSFVAAAGTGEAYVREHFKVIPEVI